MSGLPGADGLDVWCGACAAPATTLPTLILTARCTLADKVKALDSGADDFLSKPFEAAELAARCRALMRRSSGALDGIIKLNRLSVDLTGKRLCIDDAEVELTAREWLVLECLVRRVGQIVSKERVQQAVAESRAGHHAERRRSACLAAARQARRCRGDPQPARPGLSAGRSESPRDVLDQPPVGVLAGGSADAAGAVRRAGALLQQRRAGRHQQRPAPEGGGERLDGARARSKDGQVTLDAERRDRKPPLPAADSVKYAVRDAQGRLLAGDAAAAGGVR